LWGTQAGTSASSKTPEAKPSSDSYMRDFAGYYVIFTQNIVQSKHQLVVKYDVFDPNVDISGEEIGATGSGTKAGDVKFSTIGLGWVYRFDANLKLTAYYDMVTNEKTRISGYTKDLKDNVFTLRLQYKF
jgi:phosphate-selective porin